MINTYINYPLAPKLYVFITSITMFAEVMCTMTSELFYTGNRTVPLASMNFHAIKSRYLLIARFKRLCESLLVFI